MGKLERSDVQGLVVSGYAAMHHARYLLLRVVDPVMARRWLGRLADRITNSEAPGRRRCTNVALTAAGLAALGLDEHELGTFAVPFQEGMTAPHRQRALGDVGASDPATWAWGGSHGGDGRCSAADLHVLLLLFAPDERTMADVEADERAALEADGGLEVVLSLVPEPLPGRLSVGKFGVEHFGFADGLSQPTIAEGDDGSDPGRGRGQPAPIAAGEFVLGYRNGYGRLTPWPELRGPAGPRPDFGRNGTYLVFRQLAQDVAGFWSFLDQATREDDDEPSWARMDALAAKVVGRWRSGAPVVRSPHADDPSLATANDFGYAGPDPHGERCPFGAHIRRTNPRDVLGSAGPAKARELSDLHRLIRRGRVYGPALDDVLGGDDGRDRGLMFMALNANIERQFEFVQNTWCNNPKFAGLYHEQDPLLGNPAPGQGTFTVQDRPYARRVRGLSGFVTVRGGAYLFLPAISALRHLASRG